MIDWLARAAKVTDIAVKVPDGLPAGFEFRCAKGGGPEVYLTFAPSGISLAGEKSADLDRGAIVLFAINQEAFIGSKAFSLRNTTQEIIDTEQLTGMTGHILFTGTAGVGGTYSGKLHLH